MDGGKEHFCPFCGKLLKEHEHICPECGHGDGSIPANVQVQVVRGSSMRLNWATILLILYGAISLIEGIGGAFFAEGITDSIERMLNASLESIFGEGMNRSEVIKMLVIEGYISMFSGIFALIAGYCCRKRRYLTLALAGTLAASIILLSERIFYPNSDIFMLLIQFLIGILVLQMIYKSKDAFID